MADDAMHRRRPSGFAYVYDRSVGLRSHFPCQWRSQQSRELRAVARNFIYQRGMKAWSLALDPVDARFLLVGTARSRVLLYDLRALDDASRSPGADFSAADGEVCFDTSNPLEPESEARETALVPASTLAPTLQYGTSSVDWYPVDGGLFISSAFDGHVRLWDSEEFAVVGSFALRSRVYSAKFSPIATTHSLIAAATAKGELRLCDMHTNAAVHSLLGHRDEIWTLAWSPVDEHLLATGARDGEIRLWDIRRSGSTACLLSLSLDGPAVVPGRSSVHASASSKRGLASSMAADLSRKRQRLVPTTDRARGRSIDGLAAQTTGRTQQRNDPHAAASTAFVSAHRAGVNALAFTPSGHFMLSSGQDDALRLWNSATGAHQFVNYEKMESAFPKRSIQMAVVQEADARSSTLVFHPNGKHGQLNAYAVFGDSGQPLMRATAHYGQITSVVYRRHRQELFSAGEDGLIMRWRPPPAQLCPETGDDDVAKPSAGRDSTADEDTWSDDEEPGQADHRFIPPILRD